ncbi:MAG TPA: ABC transporter permease [Thermomicrobiales bacterium]|nr:ABC transporter permease [Thermomicrobiales bacterium]
MLRYIVRRLLQGIVVIFLISFMTFGLMHLAPGDPIHLLTGQNNARLTPEQLAGIRAHWGLDKPFHEQYLTWLSNALRGDFGTSLIRRGVPVTEMVNEAAVVTIKLNVISWLVALGIALPVGMIAALRRNSRFDYFTMLGATFGVALPSFWVGLMLIVLFASVVQILPSSGLTSWKSYVMPVFVLALDQAAVYARLMRSSTLDVMTQDYVSVARAKGLAEFRIVLRHVARNALLPIVTIIGLRFSFILSGTIIVEQVFGLPGLGRMFLDSVLRQDYQVVQAIVFLFAVVVVISNLITDLAYAYIDPRIRID